LHKAPHRKGFRRIVGNPVHCRHALRAGIDQAALSRLETGVHSNPTLETHCRIASTLGKRIVCDIQDAPANASEESEQLAPV